MAIGKIHATSYIFISYIFGMVHVLDNLKILLFA